MWCLKVIIASPDCKRPFSETIVQHFKSELLAEERLGEIITEYIKDHSITKKDVDIQTDEENEKELISIDEFKLVYENDDFYSYVYSWTSMDQPPFEFEIFKI
jgi:hypothetical protein